MEKIQTQFRRFLKDILRLSLVNRWIVLFTDLLLCLIGFFVSVIIRQQIIPSTLIDNLYTLALVFTVFNSIAFLLFQTHRGLIRHANFNEMWRLFAALLSSCIALYAAIIIIDQHIPLARVLVFNIFLTNLALMLFLRFVIVRLYNFSVSYSNKLRKRALVYGIGPHSIALVQWINRTANTKYQILGFMERGGNARKTRIQDLPVYNLNYDDQDRFLRKNEITTILFPDYKTAREEQSIISKFIEIGLSVFVAPPLEGLDSAQNIQAQMKPIQFEDLLGRDEIQINLNAIASQLHGKVILITGAAGSIGSELVRQLAQFDPTQLILFDVAETPLHNLRLEMVKRFPKLSFVPVIGDVRNERRLEFVFEKYHPEVIYHAAAYKHVPLMEENPCEAILDNVLGTKLLSSFAENYNAESFVMVSTDKAVNPTNVMGASKRIAEIYVQSLAKKSASNGGRTRFVTTRFGNVLGSNGSVIPHFKEQIEKGGPVTVTHPDIIRYFMTIPEACRLVLEAASFGQSGEIYVFDMGKPVKIVDLARQMIEMAGFIPDVDIKIEFTGLRPGEKLYEELLNDKEKTLPTSHEKITVAKVRQYEFDKVNDTIHTLVHHAYRVEIPETVKTMKELVPEFISQNSPYAIYDKEESVPTINITNIKVNQ
ncbi:MAG: nucleoside-diphosphate sugar epimerase/dehydratase [Bacteroidota bacterium]|nr:nucleoside-diphosphate sugar epimerase/dehydratase [Bacteroidota bacterium]